MRINLEKKEERERVAASLLRATLELAAAHGFSSLGLREVSRAAGIAPTSFYRHFADMEELGLALIESFVGRVVLELTKPSGGAGSAGAAAALVNRTFAAATADPDLFRFILAERRGATPSFRRAIAGQLAILSRTLRIDDEPNEMESGKAEHSDAVVLLLFDACGDLLDQGPERLPALSERFLRQARLLSCARSDSNEVE